MVSDYLNESEIYFLYRDHVGSQNNYGNGQVRRRLYPPLSLYQDWIRSGLYGSQGTSEVTAFMI